MATSSSFKQQCPSCEAMVPIRDPGLVGKKIDCPKCKYRFLVEEPVPEEEAEDNEEAVAEADEKSTAVTNKKGKNKRLRDDTIPPDEDEESKGKSKAANKKILYIGIGLGVVAVVALIGGGILLLGGGSPPKPAAGGGGGGAPAPPKGGPPAAPAVVAITQQKVEAPVETDTGVTDDLTNLLPNETAVYYSVDPAELLKSALQHCMLGSPGAFTDSRFKKTFDFSLDNVKRLLTAVLPTEKPDEAAFFSIMKVEKPYSKDYLEKALSLTALPTINGFDSYTVNGDLDTLSALFLRLSTPPSDKIQVHFLDGQTLVFADAAPMKKFLEDKRKPRQLTQPPPAADVPGANSAPPQQAMPTGKQSGSGAVRTNRNEEGASSRVELYQDPAPKPPMPPGGGPGRDIGGVAGRRGAPPVGGPAQPVEAEPTASNSYLTIDPNLKIALDRIDRERVDRPDREKVPPIFVVAAVVGRTQVLPADITSIAAIDKSLVDKLIPRVSIPDGLKAFAVALYEFLETKATGMMVLQADTTQDARNVKAMVDEADDLAAALFRNFWEMDVKVGGVKGGNAARQQQAPIKQTRIGVGLGAGAPGGDSAPPPPPTAASTGKDGSIIASIREKTVTVMIDLNFGGDEKKRDLYEQIRDSVSAEMVQMKGLAELVGSRPRIHELARALQAYVKAKGAFPRGALLRAPSSDRGINWYPDQRLSWMVELLPYLGDGEFKDLAFDVDRDWNTKPNLLTAQVLVPQFLAPGDAKHARIRYPGRAGIYAATRFIGIAGVGHEAATYPAGNAAYAKKLGVFGYDRVTKLEDVRDEGANTIAILQVPSGQITPWMVGGGSTVRGVSEDDDALKPFICTEYKGKKGTFAIMADGKVRFIAEDMKPAIFRGMCTIMRGERLDDIDSFAPLVPEESSAVLKAAPIAAATPDAKADAPAAAPATPSPAAGAAPAGGTPPAVAAIPEGWKEMVDEPAGFAVAMPAGTLTPAIVPEIPGVTNSKAAGIAGKDNTKYMFCYCKLPSAPPAAEQTRLFEVVRGRLLADSKIASEKPVQIDGNPGIEWVAENAMAKSTTRCFLVKDQLYALQASGATSDAKQVDAFFASFRLLKK